MPNFKIGSTSFGFYFQFLRALSKFDAKTSCAATPPLRGERHNSHLLFNVYVELKSEHIMAERWLILDVLPLSLA